MERLIVTISVDSERTVMVTAENVGAVPVCWGSGSSSCQLNALVRQGRSLVPAPAARPCTRDLVRWELAPGERRSESWRWNGRPGRHELVGCAGNWLSREAVTVTITE